MFKSTGKILAAAAGAALIAVVIMLPTSASARRGYMDCANFNSQRSAQIYFLKHGGPRYDPDHLDADHDGIACEDNPAPYLYAKHL